MTSFTSGSRVVQPAYGPGTIVEITDHHVVIDFDTPGLDGNQRRIFAAKLVTLTPLTATAAPTPPPTKKPTRKSKKESA